MRRFRLLPALLLAGCSVPEQAENAGAGNHAAPAVPTRSSTAPIVAEAVTEREELDAARYAQFPASVRPLIRTADSLNEECRGKYHAGTEAACARRDRLFERIRTLGWCWGGAETGHLQHWLPCVEDHPDGLGWREPENEKAVDPGANSHN